MSSMALPDDFRRPPIFPKPKLGFPMLCLTNSRYARLWIGLSAGGMRCPTLKNIRRNHSLMGFMQATRPLQCKVRTRCARMSLASSDTGRRRSVGNDVKWKNPRRERRTTLDRHETRRQREAYERATGREQRGDEEERRRK